MSLSNFRFCLIRRRNLFIACEKTPNNNALIFKTELPKGREELKELKTDEMVKSNERVELLSTKDIPKLMSPNRPLTLMSHDLFGIDGIKSILLDSSSSTVVINKKEEQPWSILKPQIFSSITNRLQNFTEQMWKTDIVRGGSSSSFSSSFSAKSSITTSNSQNSTEPKDEIVQMIEEILETRIRPSVQADGGDVSFVSWEPQTGCCTLMLQGACRSCPMSAMTLKDGIERMLMHYIPEILKVEQEV